MFLPGSVGPSEPVLYPGGYTSIILLLDCAFILLNLHAKKDDSAPLLVLVPVLLAASEINDLERLQNRKIFRLRRTNITFYLQWCPAVVIVHQLQHY